MSRLNTKLSIDFLHIEKGVKDLDKLSRKIIDQLETEALYSFADKLVLKLQANIMLAGYPNLASSIYAIKKRGKIYIGISSPIAKYMEYGTGLKGSESPKVAGAIPPSWKYSSGTFSSKNGGSWYYPAKHLVSKDQRHFTNEDGQLYAWTSGLPAGLFMYKTRMWARNQYTRHFRKILRQAIAMGAT